MPPYLPRGAPTINTLEDVRAWVESELLAVARSMKDTPVLVLQPIYKDVLKPRDGMLIYADGVSFNPGAGRGVYERRAGAWFKL